MPTEIPDVHLAAFHAAQVLASDSSRCESIGRDIPDSLPTLSADHGAETWTDTPH